MVELFVLVSDKGCLYFQTITLFQCGLNMDVKGRIVPQSCKISREGTDGNGNTIPPVQIQKCYVRMKDFASDEATNKHPKEMKTREVILEENKVSAAVKPGQASIALKHTVKRNKDDSSIDSLPSAAVSKLIKDCVPQTCRISHEAYTAIRKAASVFVLFATSSASAVAKESSRRTITGPDVVKAMVGMEFDNFVEPMENCLMIWRREQQKERVKVVNDRVARKDDEKIGKYGNGQNVIEID
jgi:DNA polymerase epsilon subunit 3